MAAPPSPHAIPQPQRERSEQVGVLGADALAREQRVHAVVDRGALLVSTARWRSSPAGSRCASVSASTASVCVGSQV